ncbi:MAG: class I SAM-dependent methyltransferase [Aquabacterium sp.]
MTDGSDSVSAHLARRIGSAIEAQGGWLPFDTYMQMALYEPQLGYYARGERLFGRMPSSGSDFVTAPEMTPLFGRALAAQLRQALDACGSDLLVEFGAGSGALAEVLLDTLGDAVGRYAILDVSGGLRERQQRRLARFGDRVCWWDAWPEQPIRGVLLGNEVLDAMPVSLLHWDGSRWHERGVVNAGTGAFAFADRPTDLRPPVDGPFVPGTVTEVGRQGQAFIASLADRLSCGVALFIDYGFPATEYYHPQRQGGTLMCHRGHRSDDDPLSDVGLKDITAHVDFSAIALAGQDAGLDVLGYTAQSHLLLNCGLSGLMETATLPDRSMAARLVSEHEMGELFKAILFARGCHFDPLGFVAGDRTHRL